MTRTLGEGLGAKEKSPIEFFEYSYGAFPRDVFCSRDRRCHWGNVALWHIAIAPVVVVIVIISRCNAHRQRVWRIYHRIDSGMLDPDAVIIAGLDVFLESRVLWWFDDVFDVFARNRWAHR